MHPIERLRWIARADGEASATLAAEAAWTLADLAATEPHALVTACRRLVDSHVTSAPLWWVGANMLVAGDPELEAQVLVEALCDDATAAAAGAAVAARHPGGGDGSLVAVAVASPFEQLREVCSYLPAATVRVIGAYPQLRGEVRSAGSVAAEADGYELDELERAFDGAEVLLVEAVAASSDGVLLHASGRAVVEAAAAAGVPCWALVAAGRLLHPQLCGAIERRAGELVEAVDPRHFELLVGPAGAVTPRVLLAGATCPAAPELLARAG